VGGARRKGTKEVKREHDERVTVLLRRPAKNCLVDSFIERENQAGRKLKNYKLLKGLSLQRLPREKKYHVSLFKTVPQIGHIKRGPEGFAVQRGGMTPGEELWSVGTEDGGHSPGPESIPNQFYSEGKRPRGKWSVSGERQGDVGPVGGKKNRILQCQPERE